MDTPAGVLSHFGVKRGALLGAGAEAEVFAYGDERVLRVHRPGTWPSGVTARRELLDEIGEKAADVSFAIPRVEDVVSTHDTMVSIERRLEGEPLARVLGTRVADRKSLVRAYLNATKEIWRLTPERAWYGDLLRNEPLRTNTFPEYALARAHEGLRGDDSYAHVSEVEIAGAIGDAPRSLVHMDCFPGNVLVAAGRVTAVLDFGPATLIGDRRIDPIAAVAYLDPRITPTATDEDRAFAAVWLEAQELHRLFPRVVRWLAAFWADAKDDLALRAWCIDTLSATSPSP